MNSLHKAIVGLLNCPDLWLEDLDEVTITAIAEARAALNAELTAGRVSGYENRVRCYEALGMTRSDAQGVVDAQDMQA